MKRYEVQVRHKDYGWVTAGNWPARTIREGKRSLDECAFGISRPSVHDYRLVELVPRVIAKTRGRRQP